MGISPDKALWTAEDESLTLCDLTIGQMLDQRAREQGEAPALIFRAPETGVDRIWTYQQLRDDAQRYAAGLLALGITKGAKVAILSPNSPHWIILEYALAKIGAVLVTVNPAYRRAELSYLLDNGDVHTLFCIPSFRGFDTLAMVREITGLREGEGRDFTPIASEVFPTLRHVIALEAGDHGFADIDDFIALTKSQLMDEVGRRQAIVSCEDIAQIQYTSGTTGAPKGVMLSHRSTLNNALITATRGRFTKDDRMLSPMPLFHTAGCVCNVLGCLAAGAALIAMPAFDGRRALELAESEGATIFNGAPTMAIRMMDVMAEDAKAGRHYDLSSMKTYFTGGTTILPSHIHDVKKNMGADPLVIFGMTETSPLVTMTLPGEDFELCATTAGKPMPHTGVRIFNHETGAIAGFGEQGELQIKGYLTMLGYYKMPDRTAETIVEDGWLRSGDLATLDARGYLRITGRLKDMIIRGGENIYPAEVENQLQSHPKINQAQIVGVPDEEMGEECCVFIELKAGESASAGEIAQWCRGQMARHKLPKYIFFTESFPLTPSGKIKKYELREMAQARIAQQT